MAEPLNHAPLLFLSHAGADTDAARTLKQRIETAPAAREQGLKVWFDKDDLRPGMDWQRQLEDVIERHATAFAVYLGSHGIVNWVEREVRLALDRATRDNRHFSFFPIISAAVDVSEELPGFARQFQGVSDVENRPGEFQKLVAAALGSTGWGELALEAEPFFGLQAIDESRSHLFFGRAQETQELVERLRATSLLMVTGDSGSGKSSLVRAGLIPRWRGGALDELAGRRPDDKIWHIIDMRPGRNPRRALGDSVFQAAGKLGASAADRGTYKNWAMDSTAEQVRDGLRCGLPADCTRTLIVIDQFEELLTQVPKEQVAPFIALLLELADPEDDAFAIVLTMRRDYYNLCSVYPDLYVRLEHEDRAARYLLGRMSDDGLRAIITEPLKLAGINVENRTALAVSVLQDVGHRPGDLALIQFALTETWRRRKEYGGDLLRAYAGAGRVEGALAEAAERVYAQVLGGDANQAEAEAIFIRLVRLGDTGGATRRRARRREFSETRWRQLQELASEDGNRLVLMAGGEGAETAEIAHEALVTQWPRYQTWLQEAAEDKRTLDTLIGRAAVWATADDDQRPDRLATGAEREIFVQLAQARAAWLSAEEHAFVAASNTAYEARLRQEQEAQERESVARRAAEVSRRRFQRLAVLLAVVAAMAIGIGVYANHQRQQAEQNLTVALAAGDTLVLDVAVGLQQFVGMSANRVRQILQKAEAIYSQLQVTAGDRPDLRNRQAVMLMAFADAYQSLGDTREARRRADAANGILQDLVAKEPGNAEWQRELAASHAGVGDVLQAQGSGALQAYQASLEIRQRLTQQDPGNAEWQRDLAATHTRIGHVVLAHAGWSLGSSSDLSGALQAYQASLEIRQRLTQQDPGNAEWQRDLAASHAGVGDVLKAQHNYSGALQADQASLEIYQRLTQQDPGNTRWQRELAVIHYTIGNVVLVQGDLSGALQSYQASLEIRQRLTQQDPGNAEWQRDLAATNTKIGNALEVEGDLSGALQAYQAAVAIAKRLTQQDPGNVEWQDGLLASHTNIGDVLKAQHNYSGALQAYQAAVAIAKRLTQQDPGNVKWQDGLTRIETKLNETRCLHNSVRKLECLKGMP